MMSKPMTVFAVLVLGLSAAFLAPGQSRRAAMAGEAGRKRALPDFDVRNSLPPAGPLAFGRDQARETVARRHGAIDSFLASSAAASPGTRIVPNRFGLPKTFFREGRALTTPSNAAPEDIARSFLRGNRTLFPFTAPEVDNLRLVVKDVSGGAVFLTFNQTLNDIDVFNGQIKFTLNTAGQVVHAGADEVMPELSVSTRPRLNRDEAVRAAFAKIGLAPPGPLAAATPGGKAGFRNPLGPGLNPITAELSIFPVSAAMARLAYRVFLEVDGEQWYEILIDAEGGALLYRHNVYVHAAQGRVWPQSPVDSSRQLVTFPAAWMPAGATVTTGNNIDAYLDTNGDDKPDGITTSLINGGRAFSASQVFDFPFGDGLSLQNPRNFQAAAVTNLFYLLNTAHDYFYGLGFNEAAGNFQTDKFGRGTGNDAVLAEVQHPRLTNNAAFAPTIEGTAPRIRMGLFTRGTTTPNDDLDSSFDGEVAFHEYTHGVSNRLVGSKISVSCLSGVQSGAMGEGWSDYFSISYYNNPVEGAYLTQDARNGVRRYGYEGYPFTYEDIGNEGYEVHNDGEIWAATLWDLRKALGQNVTDLLVLNGLKSTPCHPGMTDARDAILAADQAVNGGANRARIWQVFSRHGLGYSSAGTDGYSYPGIVYNAAYDQPVDLQPGGNPAIASKPPSALPQAGMPYTYNLSVSNPAAGTLSYTLSQGPSGMTLDRAGILRWNAAFTQQRVKITVTDGKGGKVVHGFVLTPDTTLTDGAPLVTDGSGGSTGFANFTVPAGTPVLQFTFRGGTGDADMDVFDPDGTNYYSGREGNTETISVASPKAGQWEIIASGYSAFSGMSVTGSLVVPTVLPLNTRLSGLSGVVGSENFYRVTVPAGTKSLMVSTQGGFGDVDLYVRDGEPAVCQQSDQVSEPCTADLSSLSSGNTESVAVSNPDAGDWYIDLSASSAYSGASLTAAVPTATGTLSVAPTALSFAKVVGGAAPASKAVAISTATSASNWTASATTDNGGNWLTVTPASGTGNTTVQVAVTGNSLATGNYSGSIAVTAAGGAGAATVQVSLTVSSTGGPVITSGGVVGAGGSIPPVVSISPGALATIYGSSFAPAGTARALQSSDLVGGSLPTNLAGTCVQADGKAGFPTFVSPGQINFQVPAVSLDTQVNVQVVANCGTSNEVRSGAVTVRAAAASPEFLYWVKNTDGKGPVIAVNAATGVYVGAAGLIPGVTFAPAKPGDILVVYGISFGPTNPSVAPGRLPDGPGNTTSVPLITMGTVNLSQNDVLYAGVTPGNAGLYQLNLRVPASLADGDYPLTLGLGTFKTPSSGFITVRGKDPQPKLMLGASALTFQTVPGQDPPVQRLTISNTGGGTLSWNATAAATGGGGWLHVSPSSGTGNGTLQVSIGAASLAAGNYTGTIIVDAGGAANSPAAVQVSLTVTSPSPRLSVAPSSLSFQATVGQPPTAQNLAISNTGGGVLNWTATAAAAGAVSWLRVSPASGTGNGTLQVSIGSTALAAGSYTGAVTISAAGASNSPATVQVALSVASATSGGGTDYRITTFAGSGSPFYSGDGGAAIQAGLGGLVQGMSFDQSGNLYLGVWTADRVRRVSTAGVITTVAGTSEGYGGDGGLATVAKLTSPFGIAVNSAGEVFIADTYNNRIRRIGLDGKITTVAGTGQPGFSGDGGSAQNAALDHPYDLKFDDQGNLIIADSYNFRIRRMTPGGTISTIANLTARLVLPVGIAVDRSGNVYAADSVSSVVVKVSATGTVTTLAGTGSAGRTGDGGPATAAQLNGPSGVAVDNAGNVFVADTNNNKVRRITPAGIISTVAGTGVLGFGGDNGSASAAQLNQPEGVLVGADGAVYVADSFNYRIRKLIPVAP